MSETERNWPDSAVFWQDKRVIVTGGAGFLGSFVVEKLAARKAGEVFAPRKAEYDRSARSTFLPNRWNSITHW